MSEKQQPRGWELKELSDVVVLQRGYDLPVSARRNGAIAVLGSNGRVGSHDVCPNGVPVPTLTVGRSGSVGKVCFSDSSAWPLNTTLFVKDYCGNAPTYIYYWLQHVNLGRYAQGVSVPTLNRNSFSSIPVNVPPFNEQLSIASVLEQCEKAVHIASSTEKKANDLKHATMHKLFSCGLRGEPQKETEIGLVPESWEPTAVDEIAIRTQYGLSVRGHTKGKYPILRMNCQADGKVKFRDLQYVDIDDNTFLSFKLNYGDILFNRTNSIEHVGRTALYTHHEDVVFASYLIRLTVDTEKCLPEFINYYLNWPTTQQEIKKLASRAVGQANINATKLRTVKIPLPQTLKEQQEIVDILDAIDQKIDLHRRKKAVLEELFKSLLHKFMTGEIRVDDLDLSALEDMQPQDQGGAA